MMALKAVKKQLLKYAIKIKALLALYTTRLPATLAFTFYENVKSIAPGQSAVFL